MGICKFSVAEFGAEEKQCHGVMAARTASLSGSSFLLTDGFFLLVCFVCFISFPISCWYLACELFFVLVEQ